MALVLHRLRSAAARLLRLWVRIPPEAWVFVCCECCVLSGTGLCDELITRPEESYRPWCVVVCDLENLMNEEALALIGLQRHERGEGILLMSYPPHQSCMLCPCNYYLSWTYYLVNSALYEDSVLCTFPSLSFSLRFEYYSQPFILQTQKAMFKQRLILFDWYFGIVLYYIVLYFLNITLRHLWQNIILNCILWS